VSKGGAASGEGKRERGVMPVTMLVLRVEQGRVEKRPERLRVFPLDRSNVPPTRDWKREEEKKEGRGPGQFQVQVGAGSWVSR
jgi:hypothetical protein